MINWQHFTFEQLSLTALYELIQLRINIFIVEQNCPYPELDNKDTVPSTYHLLGRSNTGELVAYTRILAPGTSYPDCSSIGRVIVKANQRSFGLGHQLIRESLKIATEHWPDQAVKISAQAHLEHFYQQSGFVAISKPYLEDDIPHIAMLLQRK